jgi:hypothetical protein
VSFLSQVYGKLPKGNVRVSVSDSSLGPVVTEVKGLRGMKSSRSSGANGSKGRPCLSSASPTGSGYIVTMGGR